MKPDEFKVWIEIINGIVTILAILAGGVWTFLIFVLGRSHAPNVQITIQCLQIIPATEKNLILLAVKAKNIGQILVNKERCHLFLAPIKRLDKKDALPFSRLDPLQSEMLDQ